MPLTKRAVKNVYENKAFQRESEPELELNLKQLKGLFVLFFVLFFCLLLFLVLSLFVCCWYCFILANIYSSVITLLNFLSEQLPDPDDAYEGPVTQNGHSTPDHTYDCHIPMKQSGNPAKPTIEQHSTNNCTTPIIVCIVLSVFGITTALLIVFGVVLVNPG